MSKAYRPQLRRSLENFGFFAKLAASAEEFVRERMTWASRSAGPFHCLTGLSLCGLLLLGLACRGGPSDCLYCSALRCLV